MTEQNPSPDAAADQITPDSPPAAPKPTRKTKPKPRFEEFAATRPNGTVVTVRRNIDTGESEVIA